MLARETATKISLDGSVPDTVVALMVAVLLNSCPIAVELMTTTTMRTLDTRSPLTWSTCRRVVVAAALGVGVVVVDAVCVDVAEWDVRIG